jgi:hypothetical protein
MPRPRASRNRRRRAAPSTEYAGNLPLARSLVALAEGDRFDPPDGLEAQLRACRDHGAARMGSLPAAGFGGVPADDKGPGKTVRLLALLIMPTSLLLGWQTQAAQFTPQPRLVVPQPGPRGPAPPGVLLATTCPLLARPRDWPSAQD